MHGEAVTPDQTVGAITTGSDRELLERFDLVFAAVGASQRELLNYVAATDKARYYERDGYRDHASWLAGRFHVSNWMAHRWIHAAYALERLPLISEALCSGALSLDKVLELARFATEETEKKLVTWARRVSPAAIRRRADRGAGQDLEDVKAAEEARDLRWWNFDEGRRWGMSCEFPAAEGAAIARALTRMAEKIPAMPYDEESLCEPNENDTFETRCADALSLLASQAIAEDCDADRATVVVHAELGAEFPGCDRRAYLQAHHIWHWEGGGPTELGNLVLVCGFHHKLLHEFGWQVWLDASEVGWYRPDGRRFDPGPDPPPPPLQAQQVFVTV